jgi:hypothetical protein
MARSFCEAIISLLEESKYITLGNVVALPAQPRPVWENN